VKNLINMDPYDYQDSPRPVGVKLEASPASRHAATPARLPDQHEFRQAE